ncbi:hypothetical protein PV327_007998 [Microctonus hyperodae]|uniref:RPA-interacting protein C-terminal domain-containing protein n=1 Tax=Microctonus hyperodae TaxID=165561 RepID=A0AA39KZ69_MICHY|nr:hypothetical protein PV327_007998 [Microctonus hyperodae]
MMINNSRKKMESSNYATKLLNKEAVDKLRHGQKNLREILRNRCRTQMREKREELFNARRLGLTEDEEAINNTFAEIIRREISDMSIKLSNNTIVDFFESTNNLMTNDDLIDIEEELIREHEFILQEYEEMYQRENNMMNEYVEHLLKKEVICPICQLTEIKQVADGLICEGCNLKLPPKMSISELSTVIDQRLNTHNNNCPELPQFKATLRNDDVFSINLSCYKCPYFALVI